MALWPYNDGAVHIRAFLTPMTVRAFPTCSSSQPQAGNIAPRKAQSHPQLSSPARGAPAQRGSDDRHAEYTPYWPRREP